MKNPLLIFLALIMLSTSDSAADSAREEQRRCESTRGEFGSLEGNLLHVPFAYQLELRVGTAVEEVLGTVETALVDQLLPYTFRECTEDDLITDVITGVRSNLRNNKPVDGVACRAVTNPNNLCFVVRGHLDVYLADSQAASIVRQAISLDMQAILGHHAMDHVTDEVVVVSFVDVNELPPEPPVVKTSGAIIDYDIFIYMGFTTLVLAALTLVWNRRTSSSEDYLPLQRESRPSPLTTEM